VTSIGGTRKDDFTARLEDFGYHSQDLGIVPQLSGHLLRRIHPNFLVGGEAALTAGGEWQRSADPGPLSFDWFTLSAGAVGRAETGDRVVGWAEVSAGLAVTQSTFVDQDGDRTVERYPGPYLGAAIGADVFITRGFGLSARLASTYAPTLDNLIGNQHDTGVTSLGLGLVYRQ
jgi:hypothetical protein